METNPEKIITNILDDMAEIGDWTSISDALGANDHNSHFASREEVLTILLAIKQSPELAIGRLDDGFKDLPDSWDPAEITVEIFRDPQPAGAMMEVLMRPTGQWPQRKESSDSPTT
ncbi:hypothetical protein [Corynebacterium cystitidis]|uniref:hypothetical protein n=1 Tax=Corynebacterium cystitidis TaxID=35757 RepID=UPI00211E9FE4|nr:hypothetical protein [Corynebacterium cystitidis]